jgi:hypothetical protein
MMRRGELAEGVSLGAWLAFRSGYTGRVRTGGLDQPKPSYAYASECGSLRGRHKAAPTGVLDSIFGNARRQGKNKER